MNEVMQIEQASICNTTSTTSPATAEDTASSPAGPMVFTVGQGSAPVLKLVSPVEGGAPQLIKVVPAMVSASDGASQTEGKVAGGTVMVHKVEDGQQSDGVVNQRVYSIVQKPAPGSTALTNTTSTTVAKSPYNNGQQRVHTIGALPPTARVIPASAAAQKVQILSNVVVSKQNIVLNKSALQAQRQIISTPLAQKQLNNNTQKPTIAKPQQQQPAPKVQTVNNVVLTTNQQKPAINNSVQAPKTLKTVGGPINRPQTVSQQKTIKTLSPQPPQTGYVQKTTGIKTLSPQMNHYNKQLQNPVNKMLPVQNQVQPRVGIKTLAPQRPPNNNNNSRANSMAPKPNYIGKHASQAQKSQQKSNLAAMKSRNVPIQRSAGGLSPTKYNNSQKQGVGNSQSTFNQSLTAQILQSLPSSGTRTVNEVGFTSTKNYPLQSPPDDTTLSEDIGEEVKPDFSPNLSYLYQVVMLDHNYGAPPPALSPPPVMSRSSGQHQSPGAGGSALNGAMVSSRDRDSTTGAHYQTAAAKRAQHRLPPSQILPGLETRGVVSIGPQASNHDDDAASTISSEGGHPDEGDEGEETETAPEGEGDEDGITRCICDFDHDDGYMICCDVCSSWQHVDCMGLDRDHIPDKYSCVRCQPRRVDRQHARAIQQRKREEFARLGSVVVGSVAAGAQPGAQATLAATTGSGSGNQSDTSSDTSTESDGQQGRHSVSLNNNIPKKRSAPVSVTGRRKSEPVRRAPLAHKRQQRRESAAAAASAVASRRAALKKREKKQIIKRKMKSRSSVDDSSQDSWPSNYPNMGTSMLQLRQWIENYEEAVTNHYSPELRARITNMRANGQHQGDKQDKPEKDAKLAPPTAAQDVQLQKCRVANQPLTGIKIVLAGQTLAPNTPVIELRGKYMLSTQHRSAGGGGTGGLLTRQHAQRPGPFLFFYRLPRDGTEVCVDTRTYGNDARFIRRSCRPNAELRHLVEKGTLHLYIITTSPVDKNMELTLRHESHDLAAVAASTGPATALVPCACGGAPSTCGLYAGPQHQQHRNNGVEPPETEEKREPQEIAPTHRKRRGRRASSPRRLSLSSPSSPPVSPPLPSPGQSQPPAPPPVTQVTISVAPDVAQTPPALSTRRASSHQTRAVVLGTQAGPPVENKEREPRERERDVRETRERERDKDEVITKEIKEKKKKLTREERKMEAIMKAFERLEKAEQRKQEVQARQAQRRESDPPSSMPQGPTIHPSTTMATTIQKPENGDTDRENIRTRRKKRKGRARTVSTTSQSSTRRRTRLNSTDSYMTSGDESSLLSPPLPPSTPSTAPTDLPGDQQRHTRSMTSHEDECLSPVREKILSNSGSQASDMSSPGQVNTAAGLLLALANGGAPQTLASEQSLINKSPDNDGNSSGSNSSLQSSPGTPLSSACLLVAAAVGPLEPGFKFPKTKKAIMNEWLNKSPEIPPPIPQNIEDSSSTSNQPFELYNSNNKSLATLVQAASLCDSPPQPYGGKALTPAAGQNSGNAKKRWLRQAISEECDSPSRPDSPPGSQEMVAPPKKRRLARESLSSEQSFTPPTTPTMLVPPSNSLDDETFPNNDEEFYETPSNTLSDSSPPNIDDSSKTRSVEIVYNSSPHPGAPYHHELDSETVLKDQLEFVVGGANNNPGDSGLPTSLLDPRLGRDSRPVFRDSAQLLGTVEKTIRFYEENLTGPVTVSTPQIQPQISVSPQPPSPIPPPKPSPVLVPTISPPPVVQAITPPPQQPIVQPVIVPVIEEIPAPATPPQVSPVASPPPAPVVSAAPQIKEKPVTPPQPKPEIITPAKRKLSISEYRQRKQLKAPDRSVSPTPDRCTSPETPPLAPSPASNSNSLAAAVVPKPRPRSRSASTSSTTSSLSSDEELLGGGATTGAGSSADNAAETTKTSSAVEPQVAVAFNSAPTAVERQRENVERLKKAFGLSLDDETRRNNNPINRDRITPSPKTLLSSPLLPHASTELPKSLEPTTKFSLLDSKFPALDSKAPKRLALENVTKSISSPEPVPVIKSTSEPKQQETTEEKKTEVYPKFEEVTSFIPPFNNPVYPNSTQFTSFSSVIDSSPYEGRNPSPPPAELLNPSKLSSYPSGTPLTMSPSSGYK